MSVNSLLEYWMLAFAEPVGIIVTSNNRHLLMNKLYAARKEAESQHPELMQLSICVSPTNAEELWIIHKVVRVEDAKTKE